jgi:hypothetical protein
MQRVQSVEVTIDAAYREFLAAIDGSNDQIVFVVLEMLRRLIADCEAIANELDRAAKILEEYASDQLGVSGRGASTAGSATSGWRNSPVWDALDSLNTNAMLAVLATTMDGLGFVLMALTAGLVGPSGSGAITELPDGWAEIAPAQFSAPGRAPVRRFKNSKGDQIVVCEQPDEETDEENPATEKEGENDKETIAAVARAKSEAESAGGQVFVVGAGAAGAGAQIAAAANGVTAGVINPAELTERRLSDAGLTQESVAGHSEVTSMSQRTIRRLFNSK